MLNIQSLEELSQASFPTLDAHYEKFNSRLVAPTVLEFRSWLTLNAPFPLRYQSLYRTTRPDVSCEQD